MNTELSSHILFPFFLPIINHSATVVRFQYFEGFVCLDWFWFGNSVSICLYSSLDYLEIHSVNQTFSKLRESLFLSPEC